MQRGRRRAVDIARRKRRDSHRGFPDLHQTHEVLIGASLPVVDNFPRPTEAVTFKFRVDRTSAAAAGTIVTLGNEGEINFVGGDLEVVTSGESFVGTFSGTAAAPRDSAEVVVALQPVTGQVRAWVDSTLVIAGSVTTFPYSWATSGTLDYDGIVGLSVRTDLDVFVGQLPRHFLEVAVGDPGTPAVDDILFRAAIMTNLATSRVPFMSKPD